jgi:Na+/proline symporter
MSSDDRVRLRRLVVLRWILLVLAVLLSAAVVVVLGFAVYLLIGGYSGGNNPESVAPVLIPIALGVGILVGVPAVLLCALAWAGYQEVTRRTRRIPR